MTEEGRKEIWLANPWCKDIVSEFTLINMQLAYN